MKKFFVIVAMLFALVGQLSAQIDPSQGDKFKKKVNNIYPKYAVEDLRSAVKAAVNGDVSKFNKIIDYDYHKFIALVMDRVNSVASKQQNAGNIENMLTSDDKHLKLVQRHFAVGAKIWLRTSFNTYDYYLVSATTHPNGMDSEVLVYQDDDGYQIDLLIWECCNPTEGHIQKEEIKTITKTDTLTNTVYRDSIQYRDKIVNNDIYHTVYKDAPGIGTSCGCPSYMPAYEPMYPVYVPIPMPVFQIGYQEPAYSPTYYGHGGNTSNVFNNTTNIFITNNNTVNNVTHVNNTTFWPTPTPRPQTPDNGGPVPGTPDNGGPVPGTPGTVVDNGTPNGTNNPGTPDNGGPNGGTPKMLKASGSGIGTATRPLQAQRSNTAAATAPAKAPATTTASTLPGSGTTGTNRGIYSNKPQPANDVKTTTASGRNQKGDMAWHPVALEDMKGSNRSLAKSSFGTESVREIKEQASIVRSSRNEAQPSNVRPSSQNPSSNSSNLQRPTPQRQQPTQQQRGEQPRYNAANLASKPNSTPVNRGNNSQPQQQRPAQPVHTSTPQPRANYNTAPAQRQMSSAPASYRPTAQYGGNGGGQARSGGGRH